MPLEAGGLGPGRHVPQPDRLVTGARGEPPVRQQAKGGDRAGMPLEARGLGPGRHIPQPDRVVIGARGEPPVRQQAQGGDRRRNAPRGARSRPRSPHPTAGSCCPRSPRRAARPAAGTGRDPPECPSRRAVSAPGGVRARPKRNNRRARNQPARLFKKASRSDRFEPRETRGQLHWQLARIARANAADQPQRPADEVLRLARRHIADSRRRAACGLPVASSFALSQAGSSSSASSFSRSPASAR